MNISAGAPVINDAQLLEGCRRITALLQDKGNSGLTNAELSVELKDSPKELQVHVLNKLLQDGVIDLLQKGTSLIYRIKDPVKQAQTPANIDNDEQIIYNIVAEGGSKGIWIRDIRVKSNLVMTQLNKILKALENKKLIKAVKTVNASKKKVYMLYNLEPDRSVSGGAWYQDQDFESEYVDVLNQQCLRFLQMKRDKAAKESDSPLAVHTMSCCTVAEVNKFITELGISKIALDDEDLDTILKTVYYDGMAERILQADGSYLYKAVNAPLEAPGLIQTPCGICPLIKNCSDRGAVTAKSCVYLTEWLDV